MREVVCKRDLQHLFQQKIAHRSLQLVDTNLINFEPALPSGQQVPNQYNLTNPIQASTQYHVPALASREQYPLGTLTRDRTRFIRTNSGKA